MKIGYARVSTGLQNLNLQEDRLNQYGCEKIFSDHISGSRSKRPGLDKAIEFARSGDTIVVWRLDRLGRNMEDLITLVNELNERGVSFHSLEENITMDKSSSTGQLLFHLFAAFAEFERDLIVNRTQEGKAWAKANNPNFHDGMPRKYTSEQIDFAWKLHTQDHMSYSEISRKLGMSKATIYRRFRELRDKKAAPKDDFLH